MRRLMTIFVSIASLSTISLAAQTNSTPVESNPSVSRALVEQFLAAFESGDLDTLDGLLADDVVLVMPMTFSGNVEPDFVADGRASTIAYFEMVFANFSQVRFADPVVTVSEDGSRVFVEAIGDFTTASGNLAYANVYVIRLDIVDGRINHINEYANPVIASPVLGIPLGTPITTD